MTIIDVSLHRRYADNWLEMERLEARLKELASEQRNLGAVIADNLVDAGVLALPFSNGGKNFTSYLHSSFSVRGNGGVGREEKLATLVDCGLDWMVERNYSAARLSAWAKERLASGQPLPPEFERAFHVHTEEELRLRGATSKKSLAAKAASYLRRRAAGTSNETQASETEDHE